MQRTGMEQEFKNANKGGCCRNKRVSRMVRTENHPLSFQNLTDKSSHRLYKTLLFLRCTMIPVLSPSHPIKTEKPVFLPLEYNSIWQVDAPPSTRRGGGGFLHFPVDRVSKPESIVGRRTRILRCLWHQLLWGGTQCCCTGSVQTDSHSAELDARERVPTLQNQIIRLSPPPQPLLPPQTPNGQPFL